MNTKTGHSKIKNNIADILPLTVMQKAFLLHHLQDGTDEGALQVEIIVEGDLDILLFKKSWQYIFERHEVLRISVHWEKIKRPVQIIHKTVKLPLVILDWSTFTKTKFEENLTSLKNSKTLNLSQAPVIELTLIKQSTTQYILLWDCHHLLLDGWSAVNIIKDVFTVYDAHYKKELPLLKTIPPYKTYFSWIQRQKAAAAAAFWRSTIHEDNRSLLFESNYLQKTTEKKETVKLSEAITNQLIIYARQHRITIGSIIKGIWALLLSRCIDKEIVTFGITVSGRSATIPNIDSMAGLFMNVLPVQLKISADLFLDWIKTVQTTHGRSLAFEHNTLDQILHWVNASKGTLFDTLLVFENLPWEDFRSGTITVKDFKGGLTTTYPLTLIVVPDKQYEFRFWYQNKIVGEKTATWFMQQLEQLLLHLLKNPEIKTRQLLQSITKAPKRPITKPLTIQAKQPLNHDIYVAPQNNVEVQLTRIWEEVLGISPISVTSHFFELGGTSLQAIRLFGLIQQKLEYDLSPVAILKHSTIRLLASFIKTDEIKTSWSALVPIKTKGYKAPLFCIHDGFSSVLFYRQFAKYLHKEQPIYTLQPEKTIASEKIEDIALHYVREILTLELNQPHYILLSNCTGCIIAYEMAQLFLRKGKEVSIIAIDPGNDRLPNSNKLQRLRKLIIQKGFLPTIEEKLRIRWKRMNYDQYEKTGFKNIKLLAKASRNYVMKPFLGKVLLIRSQQNHELEIFEHQIPLWTKLSPIGLEVQVIPNSSHKKLFEEPHIITLSQIVQKFIDTCTYE